jgi:NTE family protein
MSEDTVLTAVALQGGGALGAYEYGAVRALYEARGPGFRPAAITGISIGAINAAVLAGAKDPIPALDKIWREHLPVLASLPAPLKPLADLLIPHKAEELLSALGNPSMYRLRPEYFLAPLWAPWLTASVYDTSPLLETLKAEVDLGMLNSSCQVVVTAVDVESGKLARFGNKSSWDAARTGTDHPFDNPEGLLSLEHVVASGSLPPGFPMTEIGGRFYWDGGLHSNTPLSEAINCLENCHDPDHVIKRELVVVELVPMAGEKPNNVKEVMSRFFNMIFASKLELDTKLFKRYSDFVDLADKIQLLLDAIDKDQESEERLNKALNARSEGLTIDKIRHHHGVGELLHHEKIDYFSMIPFTAGQEFRNASDFSRASIEARIQSGYEAARRVKVGEPQPVR